MADDVKVLSVERNTVEIEEEELALTPENIPVNVSGLTATDLQEALEELESSGGGGSSIFGSEFEYFEDTSSSTTTSNGWRVKFSDETQQKPAGDYLIFHSAQISMDDDGGEFSYCIQYRFNNSGSWTTIEKLDQSVNEEDTGYLNSGHIKITIPNNNTVAFRFRYGKADGEPVTLKNTRFTIWRVS